MGGEIIVINLRVISPTITCVIDGWMISVHFNSMPVISGRWVVRWGDNG